MSVEEQDFLSLLDSYVDKKEIQEIIDSDEEEYKKEQIDADTTIKHKINSNFSIEDTITIREYVTNYLGIKPIGYDKNLWHSGLKELGSNLVFGVDNNFANKNPETVKSGFLLLVIDDRGNRGTYINPFYLKKWVNSEDVSEQYRIFKKKRLKDLEELRSFYNEYNRIKQEIENNEYFYQLLRSTHKLNKAIELKREEKSYGKFYRR